MPPRAAWICLVLAGCGPSYQALYEGEAKFERCYALDEDPARPMGDKAGCWREWQERYTYGQTRDRVEYASARHRALSRGTELPTDEAMMQAAPGETGDARRVRASPAPTSAFVPPPSLMARDGGVPPMSPVPAPILSAVPVAQARAPTGDAGPAAAPPKGAPPSNDCGERCGAEWRACQGKADACDKGYRKCMRVCFK
jgi:hypothetical protein